MLIFSREFRGRSFTAIVLTEAEKWLLTCRQSPPPDLVVQDTAFHRFSRHKNIHVLRTAYRFFRLSGPRYVSTIQQFANEGDFKRACDCACALELYDVFDARTFCLPLLLEERLNTAESYLERSPTALRGLMRVLDELSDPGTERELLAGLCGAYPQLATKTGALPTGADKLTGKPLNRLIRRYAEKFGLNLAADLPKFSRRAALSDLKYWIYEYYEGGSKDLTLGCWRELIERKAGLA